MVACIQETKLKSNSQLLPFPNYSTVRRDRPGPSGGGGLITLVHHSIQYSPINTDPLFPNDNITEHLAITAIINDTPLKIFNIYIPPTSSCPPDFSPSLDDLLSPRDDTLILGDFNAHSPAWFSQTSDTRAAARGEEILDSLIPAGLVILNSDTPTRLPSHGAATSPDLSITTPEIATDFEWTTETTLNSDHLPILIYLGGCFSTESPQPQRISYSNLKKADWDSFTRAAEETFALMELPSSAEAGETQLRKVLLTHAKHYIPTGYIPNYIPNLPDSTIRLIRERDQLRSTNPSDPQIHALDQHITQEIARSKQDTWTQKVESCSHNQNSSYFWSLLRTLSGKRPPLAPNQPITFNDTHITNPLQIATSFNKQFTTPFPHFSDRTTRHLKKHITRTHPLNTNISPFTTQLVTKAVGDSGNSRAFGPDGLTIHHIKHLGPLGILLLTHIFNLSYNTAKIPSIWKHSIVVPILKPGKPASLGTSYRPISLLCPAIKVFERLLIPELNTIPISPTQHGYRPNHSTTTALLPLTHKVALGFNQPLPPDRTVTVAIDFSKAFDTVSHTKLIIALSQTTLQHNTVRWLSAYLRGRMACCRYNNTTSAYRHVHAGVPQGSCISPVLFNFYVSTYPLSPQLTSSYADDFTNSFSSPHIPTASDALSTHASQVCQWADERDLSISAPKSTVTLFTSDTHQSHSHPAVLLRNTPLPLERKPRILGVTFDTHFTFTPHINTIIQRTTPRLNIMRALAGTTWGQSKETLLITFKSLIKSIFTYACPIWFPITRDSSSINKLQVVQNAALRIATGCVRMTEIGHLHAEAAVLPVREHLSLLSSQFLARCLVPSHPSHTIVTAPSGPRRIKHTLQSRFLPAVAPHLTNGTLTPDTYKDTIKTLHTSAVTSAISSRRFNRVLASPDPTVSEEEKTLPRAYRTTLAQLRSGFSPALNTYLHRINKSPDDLCPSCRGAPHTTSHLFTCGSHPTSLTVRDLWDRPCAVAEFLATLGLPVALPPLRRPPPEPPPTPLPPAAVS